MKGASAIVSDICFFLSEGNLTADAAWSCLCSASQNLVGEVGQSSPILFGTNT